MDNLIKTKLKSFHLIIIISSSFLVLHVLFAFILYNPILHFVVGTQKALKPGNEIRDFYLKLPVPLDFRVYFFNVTNPEEVRSGEKPKVEEVGPYCYDAFKEKVDVDDNKKADTLTYSPYDTYFYNHSRTGDRSHDDYVTILNPLTVAIINTVAAQKPQYLGAINKVLPIIFQENAKIFMTVMVRDILFDGILIDCNVKDFTASAVCHQFKGQPSLIEVDKNIFKFSLFGPRNGSSTMRISVKRGIKKARDIGKVVAVNNKTSLETWSNGTCNEYHGTDGWIFPSFLTKEEGIWTVAADLCRMRFIDEFKYKGVGVRKYYADLGDMSSNPEEKCFCPSPETCLPKGVMDLSKCLNAPIHCTLPHFLEVDKSVVDQVEGLNPVEEKHMILVYFDPITGTPLLGQRRIQFNFQLKPIAKIDEMKTVRNVLHPVLWIEEGIELEGFLLKKITTAHILLKIATIMRYAAIFLWLGLLISGSYKLWKDRKNQQVVPLPNAKATQKGIEKIVLPSPEGTPAKVVTLNRAQRF